MQKDAVGFSIREAQDSDREGVTGVFESDRGKRSSETVKALWEVWIRDPGNTPLVVVSDDNRIVGFANLSIYHDREGWLEDLVVHPHFRRKGLSTALIENCEERVRQLSRQFLALDVFADNCPAMRMYEERGYANLFSYLRLDGEIDHGLMMRAGEFGSVPGEVLVRPPQPQEKATVWQMICDSPGFKHDSYVPAWADDIGIVTQLGHKSRTFDKTDFDLYWEAGTVLVATDIATRQLIGALMFQIAKLWKMSDRIVANGTSLALTPSLNEILVINFIAVPTQEQVRREQITKLLVATVIAKSGKKGIKYTRAYPFLGADAEIDILCEFGLSIPYWERGRHFRVYAKDFTALEGKHVRLIAFDLVGTLIKGSAFTDARRWVQTEIEHTWSDAEEQAAFRQRFDYEAAFRVWMSPEEKYRQFRNYLVTRCTEYLYGDVYCVLKILDQRGISIGFVTDGSNYVEREMIQRILKFCEIDPDKCIIVTGQDVGADKQTRKPFFELIERAKSAAFGIQHILFVGDNDEKDRKTAESAGLMCRLIRRHSPIKNRQTEIASLVDLIQLLDGDTLISDGSE